MTAALEKVTSPGVVSVGPVLAGGCRVTGHPAEPPGASSDHLVHVVILRDLGEVELVGDAAGGVGEAPVGVVGASEVGGGTSDLGEGWSRHHGLGHDGVEGDEDDGLEDEHDDDEGDVDTAGGSIDMILDGVYGSFIIIDMCTEESLKQKNRSCQLKFNLSTKKNIFYDN